MDVQPQDEVFTIDDALQEPWEQQNKELYELQEQLDSCFATSRRQRTDFAKTKQSKEHVRSTAVKVDFRHVARLVIRFIFSVASFTVQDVLRHLEGIH